jgi:hypothetical protein
MKDNIKKIVEIKIGFDTDREEISYIESDFMNEEYNYKDPIEYTVKLMEMALEKWIREKIGIICPNCDSTLEEGWLFCAYCGYDPNK